MSDQGFTAQEQAPEHDNIDAAIARSRAWRDNGEPRHPFDNLGTSPYCKVCGCSRGGVQHDHAPASCSCGGGDLPAPWHKKACAVLTEWLQPRHR